MTDRHQHQPSSDLRAIDPVFGREVDEIERVRRGLSAAAVEPPQNPRPLTLADYVAYAARKTERPTESHVRHFAEAFASELKSIFPQMKPGHRYRVVPMLSPNTPGYLGLPPNYESRYGHLHYHVVRDDGLTLHVDPVYLTAILPAELIEAGLELPEHFPKVEDYHPLVEAFEATVRSLINRVHGEV